jgi:tetratricopeptide (TPR) repeat protein
VKKLAMPSPSYKSLEERRAEGARETSEQLADEGAELLAGGDAAGAGKRFRLAADLDPGNARLHTQAAEAMLAGGDRQEALTHLDQARGLANELEAQGRKAEAAEIRARMDTLLAKSRETPVPASMDFQPVGGATPGALPGEAGLTKSGPGAPPAAGTGFSGPGAGGDGGALSGPFKGSKKVLPSDAGTDDLSGHYVRASNLVSDFSLKGMKIRAEPPPEIANHPNYQKASRENESFRALARQRDETVRRQEEARRELARKLEEIKPMVQVKEFSDEEKEKFVQILAGTEIRRFNEQTETLQKEDAQMKKMLDLSLPTLE